MVVPLPDILKDLYDPKTGRMRVKPCGNAKMKKGKKYLVIPDENPMGQVSHFH